MQGQCATESWDESMKLRASILVLGFAIAAGRAHAQGHPISVPFSESDLVPWQGSGQATIRGQAFLKTIGGDVKTCAGNSVVLFPLDAYGRALMSADLSSNDDPGVDPRFASYVKQTTCDAQGNFVFENVAAQEWGIETSVTWSVPHVDEPGDQPGPIAMLFGARGAPGFEAQGGVLVKEAAAHAGENQVFLTALDERR